MKKFQAPELTTLKPEDWRHYGLWKQDVFSAAFWQSCFDPEILRGHGFEVEDGTTIIANGGHFFCHAPTVESVRAQLKERIALGDSLESYAQAARDAYQQGIAFAERTAPDAPLTAEYFEEFLLHARRMTLYWWFAAVHLAISIEQLLAEAVAEHHVSPEAVQKLIPKVQTPLLEQQQELLVLRERIAGRAKKEIMEDTALMEVLEDHCRRYGWIETTNWVGEELSLDRLLGQIEHTSAGTHTADTVPPEPLRGVLAALGAIGFAKQGGAEYMAQYEYLMMPYLQRIAERLGLSYRELMRFSHDEIAAGLGGDVQAVRGITERSSRQHGRWILVSIGGEARLLESPEDADLLAELLIPKVSADATSITGTIGNKGRAEGRVKVILNVDEFHKMEPGDVLVTTMTTPDFVILMQKASAIVTDIGGLLSHAAIISREINKPCIIGAKIATTVLKDNDLVEVDANEGVVRILRR